MKKKSTAQLLLEFREYVRTLTDAQVRAVFEKESAAGRRPERIIAKMEIERREESRS